MTDDSKKSRDEEIAALRARVDELERAAKPPEPFKPEPFQRYDPTANMSMPRSTLLEMARAVPDHMLRDIVHDNQAPQGRPGVIPSSPSSGGNVAGDGTGWAREIHLGPSMHQRYVDAQIDAQDMRDRQELIKQKAEEAALLKAAETK
jgi:hypothetical protein